ncbi:MAG: UDP-N-acetylglucosamine 2-epimerase [Terriglobales bacterium]
MRTRKIAVVTTSRSDYAHLRWLLHDLENHPSIDLRVIAIGPHLSPEFGHTARKIHRRKKLVTVVESLLSSDTDVGMAKSLGLATLGLADVLGRMRPDIVLLIADRYEMLAPASVALTLRIPIAHIEGGEITSGAIDDAVRNALTKMSHLHFACTKDARKRMIAQGEEAWRITLSGSLSLDDFRRARLLTTRQLEKQLNISLGGQTILVVYHPVTLLKDTVEEATQLFSALEKLKQQLLFIYPNADAGSRRLIQLIKRFVSDHARAKAFVNLDHPTFLSMLRNVDLLIGNSSSGLIESTTAKLPTINIGIRQRGREHASNVLGVSANNRKIIRAIRQALSPGFKQSIQNLENPYGDGRACSRIVSTLARTPLGSKLLFKT